MKYKFLKEKLSYNDETDVRLYAYQALKNIINKFLESGLERAEVEDAFNFALSNYDQIINDYYMDRDESFNESCSKQVKKELVESDNSQDNVFQAFLTNLGKYAQNILVGDWFTFPMSEDEFEDALTSIGIGSTDEFGGPYEEWFVTDYNDPFSGAYAFFGEHPSFEQLNEYGELVASAGDDKALGAIMEVVGDFNDAKNIYESGNYHFYPDANDMSDVAEQLIDEIGGVESLSKDMIETYFDYEKLGRDINFDSYEDDEGNEITAGEYWCGDEGASDSDIGYAYVDEVGFDSVSNPEYYFDYDAYGRDLSLDNFTETDYGIIEIIY